LKSPFRYYDSDLRPKKNLRQKFQWMMNTLKLLAIRKTGQPKKDRLIYFRDMFYFKCIWMVQGCLILSF
jgi:hypothetical protein